MRLVVYLPELPERLAPTDDEEARGRFDRLAVTADGLELEVERPGRWTSSGRSASVPVELSEKAEPGEDRR